MKFGRFSLDEATGGILAHSIKLKSGKALRKGVALDEATLELLRKNGVEEVHAAIAEAGDISEDEAATRIAGMFADPSLSFETASTGRVNIHAAVGGLFCVSACAVDAINALDPSITLATLADHQIVEPGRLIASLKIIPYALPAEIVEQCEGMRLTESMKVRPFVSRRVGLIQSLLGGTKPSILEKTRRTLVQRLNTLGCSLAGELRVEHSSIAISAAIAGMGSEADLVVVFGASAISDIRDEIPSGIEEAGGEVVRFGMPVDPGNLLLLGRLGDILVVGAPGCARGPAENGFDWVLQQIVAGIAPEEIEFAGMGVGGLLMESTSRPHPRQQISPTGMKTGIILAAGLSRRMGDANKMTKLLHGKPLLRHVAEHALASKLDDVVVVTGHEAETVRSALQGLPVTFVDNPSFEQGLSTSIAAGIDSLTDKSSHAMILLGDMPFVDAAAIDALLERSRAEPRHIVSASNRGKRGNPVLWPRAYFEQLSALSGDIGAKHLIARHADDVAEVEIGAAAAMDLDTPEAVAAAEQNRSEG